MNVQQIDRTKFLADLQAVEERFPLHFIGMLPRGTAAHVRGDDAVDLLAEKREGLSLLSLAGAENDLAERIGRPCETSSSTSTGISTLPSSTTWREMKRSRWRSSSND